MTVFDLSENPGVWFDMEGGGRVQLKTLAAEDLKAIRKQSAKKRVEYKRIEGKAERFDVEDVDEDAQNQLFWDHVIMSWEKFFDSKGEPIPCTKENKVLLMQRSIKFARFVTEALRTLSEDETAQAEATEKN
jgi:hypothetical protein